MFVSVTVIIIAREPIMISALITTSATTMIAPLSSKSVSLEGHFVRGTLHVRGPELKGKAKVNIFTLSFLKN
jgi:hypothetical protein